MMNEMVEGEEAVTVATAMAMVVGAEAEILLAAVEVAAMKPQKRLKKKEELKKKERLLK